MYPGVNATTQSLRLVYTGGHLHRPIPAKSLNFLETQALLFLARQLPKYLQEARAGPDGLALQAAMNKRLLLVLLCAFVIASACTFLVYRLVGRRMTATQRNSTRVVVAANDIKLGSVLKDVDLTTTEIEGAVPRGAILNAKDAIGRGVLVNLSQNEPVLESRLAAAGSGGGLAATIPQGMRACAVKVDEVVGVAGFVTPGMRVDVLISGTPPGASNPADGPKVRTLLQNIEVLAAGTDIQKD